MCGQTTYVGTLVSMDRPYRWVHLCVWTGMHVDWCMWTQTSIHRKVHWCGWTDHVGMYIDVCGQTT